jgi:hypothetical protein
MGDMRGPEEEPRITRMTADFSKRERMARFGEKETADLTGAAAPALRAAFGCLSRSAWLADLRGSGRRQFTASDESGNCRGMPKRQKRGDKWSAWIPVAVAAMTMLGSVGCSPEKIEPPLPEVTLTLRPDPMDPWTISARNPGQTSFQPFYEGDKYRGQIVWIAGQKFLTVESFDPEARNQGPWKYTVHDRKVAKFRITVDGEKLKLMKDGKVVETPFSPADDHGKISVSQP